MNDDNMLKKLGHNIKVERVKLDYTQEKLSEISGVQAQHLGKIENGSIDLRFTTLVSILEALNVPFEKVYELNLKK